MQIGVALIGSGLWAREEHLPALHASKHLKLKAVYSRSAKTAGTIASDAAGIDIYSDDSDASYDDLLQRSDIGAVVIALPIGNQKDYIRAALVAGKHVLSEKPVAENLKDAHELIQWYRKDLLIKATWHVAENWRFLETIAFAKQESTKLGRLLGFRVRIYDNIQKGWKFFETEWRKHPTHQGGFLLDGGVHYVAGLRRLLESQPTNKVSRLSSFTTLLQDHLPPVDTINAILKLESGVSGTYQQSVGTSLTGAEWTVGYEHGVVTVADSKVIITAAGETKEKIIQNERTGVPPVVRVWGEAITKGTTVKDLSPEEGLADLELLELMLWSGENGGKPISCEYQHL